MAKLDISKQSFNPAQLSGLDQRLSLLKSFMESPKKKTSVKRPRFLPGQLTIIDLSDPFLDAASACGLFEIIVRLFVRADVETGKVLVVDEAHKVGVCSQSSCRCFSLNPMPVFLTTSNSIFLALGLRQGSQKLS